MILIRKSLNGLIGKGRERRNFTLEMVNMETQKVWLVCGANEGIGEATVKYLLLRGQQVVAIPSPGSDADNALQSYYDKFPLADWWLINLFNAPDTEKAVRQIVQQYGRIDRLVNIDDSGLLSMHVLPVMQDVGKGHIIQFASGKSKTGAMDQPHGVKMQFDIDEADGVHYTFLSPGLCFQLMLAEGSIWRTHGLCK